MRFLSLTLLNLTAFSLLASTALATPQALLSRAGLIGEFQNDLLNQSEVKELGARLERLQNDSLNVPEILKVLARQPIAEISASNPELLALFPRNYPERRARVFQLVVSYSRVFLQQQAWAFARGIEPRNEEAYRRLRTERTSVVRDTAPFTLVLNEFRNAQGIETRTVFDMRDGRFVNVPAALSRHNACRALWMP